MAGLTLQPLNIILANIYVVMIIQLSFNWQFTNCETKSYFFQLAFILLMTSRLFIQELYNNHKISFKVLTALSFLTSGVLLGALGIYQAITIANNPGSFYYDAAQKLGNQTCFQNRIVFVGEIIIGFLAFFKDIYFLIIAKQDTQATEKVQ